MKAATGPAERRRVVAAVLAAFAVAFVWLEVAAYTRKSATWDEPIHLAAGYAALTRGDFRVDPSHPPLLRMWAALPLLTVPHVVLDTAPIDRTPVRQWIARDAYGLAHRFMYQDNDGDRLLYRARLMVVLLGVLLGVVVFAWAYEWLGPVPALVALGLYAVSPNLAAHAALVTTDFGVTLFVCAAVYCLWRTHRRFTAANVAGLTAAFVLAVLSKFSGIVLAPIVGVLLVVSVAARSAITPKRALGIAALLGVATWAAIWACYGFRYAPGPSAGWVLTPRDTAGVFHGGVLGPLFVWVDAHHLLPNAFTLGFQFGLSSADRVGGFLGGEVSAAGWWYYFPLAFLIKTPLSLIVLWLAGLVACVVRWRRFGPANEAFVLVPAAVFFGAAVWSGINLGVRHILPVYPFVILIGAAAARELLAARAGRYAVAALVAFGVFRFATIYPNTLTFFNQSIGGARNGSGYLVDSNLDWGQHLKALKKWMDGQGVEHINLAYFGSADPMYYGIHCTYLPGGPSFALPSITRPALPGYVAVSETVLSGVYLQPQWRLFYSGLSGETPVAEIGHTIRIYWLNDWPEDDPAAGDPQPPADTASELTLADALLYGMHWSDHAIVHYRRYLDRRPLAGGAFVGLGLALAANGRVDEAVATFRRAAIANPSDARVRRFLAASLLDNPAAAAEAEVHARKAVELGPRDAAAHDVLGRALATEGRFDEAGREFRRALELDPSSGDARSDLRRLDAILTRR